MEGLTYELVRGPSVLCTDIHTRSYAWLPRVKSVDWLPSRSPNSTINLATVTLPKLAASLLPVVVPVGSQDKLPLPPSLQPMFTDHLLYQKPRNATTGGG